MIVLTIEDDGDVERDLEESADRAERLGDMRREVVAALVAANAEHNFDPEHENSIVEVRPDGSGAIGAKAPREDYADLLEIPDDEIADIYYRYIVEGD